MKIILGLIISLICSVIAVIPGGVMYFIFRFINPMTEVGRIATGGLLLWFGVGLSVLALFGAFMLWLVLMKALTESY